MDDKRLELASLTDVIHCATHHRINPTMIFVQTGYSRGEGMVLDIGDKFCPLRSCPMVCIISMPKGCVWADAMQAVIKES